MENIILNAATRTDLGKSGSRHIRKQGMVPGVVYRAGETGVNVQMGTKDLWRALHSEAGSNAIITMNIAGSGKAKAFQKTVILKEVQTDHINDHFIHVDFCEISLTEKLQVKVPVVAKGEAAGVSEENGVLTQLLWEMEVECLPTAIPEHLDVHVDALKLGDAIHVKDIVLPEGVVALDNPEQVVFSVHVPHVEEEAVEEGAEGEVEPELIKKGKKEEEEEAASSGE
ncbi:MAG: 50S ribosomal protein L25 [Candidatus Omnitrophota bacterium]